MPLDREHLQAGSARDGLFATRPFDHWHRYRITGAGGPAELVHDQATDRVVVVVLGQLDSGGVLELVDARPGGNLPRAVRAPKDQRLGVVVFIQDVADDLLGDILEGEHAGEAAVLVHDHGELAVLDAQS